VLLTKYYIRMIKIMQDEMGGACSTRDSKHRFIRSFGKKGLKKEGLEDSWLDGRTILK
jgi:hypothetical protein